MLEIVALHQTDAYRAVGALDLADGLRIVRLAVDTHLITSHYLLPLLVDRPAGPLVEVTDGTADYNASGYRISVFYDLAKVAVNRLVSSGQLAREYGFTDLDGSRPDIWRYIEDVRERGLHAALDDYR